MSIVVLVCVIGTSLSFANDRSLCADTKNGYRLHYPSDWTVQQSPDSEDLVKANISKDDETGLQVRVYTDITSNLNTFLEGYVPDFDHKMRQQWGGEMIILEQRYTTFDQQRGFIISFDFKREDGARYFFKQYLISRDNKVYVIQCGTPFDLRSINETLFDSIAESFELL